MRLTDWQGSEYGPGDTIIYPVMSGRSVEMQQATVLDIFRVYYDDNKYKWTKLKNDQEIPTKLRERWSGEDWQYEDTGEPSDTRLRVRLQPDGKGSRDFHTRKNSETIYVDPDGNDIDYYEMKAKLEAEHGPEFEDSDCWKRRWLFKDFGYSTRHEAVTPKPVTLLNYENITLLKSN